jgi:hypothetical protein
MTLASVKPLFMTEWGSVQLLAVHSPLGHEKIHVFAEFIIMTPHPEMKHLVDKDILEAFKRLLCEICVQSNAA